MHYSISLLPLVAISAAAPNLHIREASYEDFEEDGFSSLSSRDPDANADAEPVIPLLLGAGSLAYSGIKALKNRPKRDLEQLSAREELLDEILARDYESHEDHYLSTRSAYPDADAEPFLPLLVGAAVRLGAKQVAKSAAKHVGQEATSQAVGAGVNRAAGKGRRDLLSGDEFDQGVHEPLSLRDVDWLQYLIAREFDLEEEY